jgi:hypothetical protein
MKTTTNARGFKGYEPVKDTYGAIARVHESSSASQPCVWIWIDDKMGHHMPDGTVDRDNPGNHASLHLTEDQAKELCEKLMHAFENHYQKGS